MEKKDIIEASFEYKQRIERIEGNFHTDRSLDSVAHAFREGAEWYRDSIWLDKTIEPNN